MTKPTRKSHSTQVFKLALALGAAASGGTYLLEEPELQGAAQVSNEPPRKTFLVHLLPEKAGQILAKIREYSSYTAQDITDFIDIVKNFRQEHPAQWDEFLDSTKCLPSRYDDNVYALSQDLGDGKVRGDVKDFLNTVAEQLVKEKLSVRFDDNKFVSRVEQNTNVALRR